MGYACKLSGSKVYQMQIKTPEMGSYTIPSGQVIESSSTGYFEGWRAFNDSELRGWLSHNSGTWLYAGTYIGYIFPKDIEIVSANIKFKPYDKGSSSVSGKFQVYNNNNWIDISSVFTLYTSHSYTNINLNNIGKYKQYRWLATTNASSSLSYGIKLKFYGKTKFDPSKYYILI